MLKALGMSKYPINVDDASNKCPDHTNTGIHTSARKIAAQYLRKERKGDRWNLLRLANHLKHGSIRYPDVYICVYMYIRCEHVCVHVRLHLYLCVYMYANNQNTYAHTHMLTYA